MKGTTMNWAKRDFRFAEYAPYMDRLEALLIANPTLYRQFIMVSTKTDDPAIGTYFIGMPSHLLLSAFDGFAPVAESELPKEIDTLLIADATTEEFKSRFGFRGRR
jgi:hypothetical protein